MQNISGYLQYIESSKRDMYSSVIENCYLLNSSTSVNDENTTDLELNCSPVFDGFACWHETKAGVVAYQPCPEVVVGFDSGRLASKMCTENGSWYQQLNDTEPWTNYTDCVNVDDLKFRQIVNNVYVGGYAVSLIAIVLALGMFFYLRTLRCMRIVIHMHMFTAFVFNNATWIIWHKAVVEIEEVVRKNPIWCQIVHVISMYTMLASYMWMFAESLHLYLALVLVFIDERLALRCFIGVGWFLPLLLTVAYVIVRYSSPGATERCWIDDDNSLLIINVPVSITLVLSFVFLINIIWIIISKIRSTPNRGNSITLRKAVRAAMTLIPLFGVQFLLYPFRPAEGTVFEKVYDVVTAILTSTQGLLVAVLFCFLNHDVLTAVRIQFQLNGINNEAIAMTVMSRGESAGHVITIAE